MPFSSVLPVFDRVFRLYTALTLSERCFGEPSCYADLQKTVHSSTAPFKCRFSFGPSALAVFAALGGLEI